MPRDEYAMKPIASAAVAIFATDRPHGPSLPRVQDSEALRIANAGAEGIFAQFKAHALV